jgi:hypothetical protein
VIGELGVFVGRPATLALQRAAAEDKGDLSHPLGLDISLVFLRSL